VGHHQRKSRRRCVDDPPDGTVHGPVQRRRRHHRPWGIAIDGNDNVWVASSTSHSVTQLCGVRTETCPPGLKTGDPITPSEGYIGGLQTIAPIAIDPAGNAWVGNGFHDTETGFSKDPREAQSTQFGAHTIVVFFGVAKPVRTPLIGPEGVSTVTISGLFGHMFSAWYIIPIGIIAYASWVAASQLNKDHPFRGFLIAGAAIFVICYFGHKGYYS
jgi:hypothetical protein